MWYTATALMKEMSVTIVAWHHEVWIKSDTEQSRFPFTGKPGINVDFDDPSNPLGIF
jgi:hypothetical protein